jgi:hypothetical protein
MLHAEKPLTKVEMAIDLGSLSYIATERPTVGDNMTQAEWAEHYMTFDYDQLLDEMISRGLL